MQEVLAVEEQADVVGVVLNHVYEVVFLEVQLEGVRVEEEGEQLDFALDGEHEEHLAHVGGVDFALLGVVEQHVFDLCCLPLLVQHHLYEVY